MKKTLIRIRGAKWKKDRINSIFEKMLHILGVCYKEHSPKIGLFEDVEFEKHIKTSEVKIFRKAKDKACIMKHVIIHKLRYVFFTYSLKYGADLMCIHKILAMAVPRRWSFTITKPEREWRKI